MLIGTICALKGLKNTSAELQLIFFSVLNTSSVLFCACALIDVSSIAALKLCPVEKVSPRYL